MASQLPPANIFLGGARGAEGSGQVIVFKANAVFEPFSASSSNFFGEEADAYKHHHFGPLFHFDTFSGQLRGSIGTVVSGSAKTLVEGEIVVDLPCSAPLALLGTRPDWIGHC
jgi:hypothetical protein